MSTSVVNVPETVFQWIAPAASRYIACAVFSCNPVVAPRIGDNPGDQPPEGLDSDRYKLIANATSCVVSLQLTGASRDTLPFSSGFPQRPQPLCDPEQAYRPVLAFLAGACWAYDEFHVIAASELVRVDPTKLVDTGLKLPMDSACLRTGDDCYEHGYFGQCSGTSCMPRCMTAQDCEEAAIDYLEEPRSATCKWECPKPFPSDSLVGVCERLP